MEKSVLACWRSLLASGGDPLLADVTDERRREQFLSYFVSTTPFSSSSSSSSSSAPDAGGARLTRKTKGWAQAVARLRWWALIADGPHSCLAFLDQDDDDDGGQTVEAVKNENKDEDEDDKAKEELIGVLGRALGEEKRRGERRWIKAWFGDEWAVPRLWSRVGRAVRRLNMDLADELLNTMEWLSSHGISEDACEDYDDHQKSIGPGAAADVLLYDILKSTTPQHIICTAIALLPRSLSSPACSRAYMNGVCAR
jgi:hypothetical protein